MDTDEIRTYSERYSDGYPDEHQEIEKEFGGSLNEKGYLTQNELASVIKWKLENVGSD